MDSPKKAETRKVVHTRPRTRSQNDSEDELQPPSPIDIATEPALSPDFSYPDAQELRRIESDTQNRLKAILEVAGVTGLSQIDARTFQDPEILRKLTNSVSTALDEAATALTRMKSEKQTYEAFLKGASQAPSPPAQHEPPMSNPAVPSSTANGGVKISANVTIGSRQQQQKPPSQQQQAPVGEVCPQTPPLSPQPQSQQPHSLQEQASDSMQSLQRLLTQGHTIQDATEDGESLLSLACSAGYYELAEVLLRMRASVEDRGVKGDSTPLMEAASGGYSDIVKLLIDHGANVNAKSSVGNTALTYACCGGYEDVVKILLEAGADVEHQNENGHTPLMEAASCGHVGVAKLLLEYGANINTHSNEFKESALTLACYKGHLEMVKFLLSAGADQEHKTDEMHTALMEASMDGHVDVARLLLDHGAQVNMPVDSFESPLTLAACGGHYELAALLISRGADLEEVNDEGYTPLMEAAREGHEDVVQLLVEHGANVNAQTEETQETALTLACCGGFIEVAQYLIEHGADIELGASTPLMEAAQEGHVNIVKFLIDRGALINAETNTGDTALTYACANGHTHIADILLQCGADLEHESEGGRTPVMKAARAGHLQTVQFLVSKGANVNRHTSNNDHTVLSLASAGGHISVVQYLLIKGAHPSHLLRDNSTMLIEASRGGHTNVANLLLRQPRHMLNKKGTTPEPTEDSSTTHPNQLLTGIDVRDRKSVLTRKADSTSSRPGGEGSTNQLSLSEPSVPGPGVEGGVPAQHDEAYNKPLSGDGVGLGVKRLKMSESKQPPKQLGSPTTGQQSVVNTVPLPNAPVNTVAGYSVSPGSKNASTAGPHQESGSSVDLPPSSQGQHPHLTNQLGHSLMPAQMTHPPGCHVTGTDVIKDHTTADAIIEEYWKHRKIIEAANQPNSQDATTQGVVSGIHTATLPLFGFDSAQSMFSAGNFSSLPIPGASTPSGPRGVPLSDRVSDQQESQVHMNAGLPSAVEETNPLANVGLSRLIPHLETLAGSLQDPNSLESRYLAALATHTQLGMPAGTTVDPASTFTAHLADGVSQLFSNGLDVSLPHATEGDDPTHIPSSSIDTPALLSSAEIASLLPSLANFDAASADYVARHLEEVGQSDPQHPMFPADFNTMKQLSDRMQFMAASVGRSAGTVDERGVPLDADSEGLLNNRTPHQPPSSLLLESNFPLDIPPPDDLVSAEHLSAYDGSGYEDSLENETETYPTSEEDVGNDEDENELDGDESDTSYIVPDLSVLPPGSFDPAIDIEQETDSNHDTALTLAAAGGHDELVELLLAHGANIEHKDKKGCTALILAASAGHAVTVAILLDHNANIEAQSDRTKDTALSLACSGGRQEVVELLLAKGANFEHRNVSDYTPLSLAASGGYVIIIKLLLRAGADINSRTGSKLGISPLMLAAMNGHTSTVKLLLDMGSDINAQIETNRNTALTLACFQGRHEVVSLLVERQANVEHRAKTGLTPLMEAASGGYHEVGRVLICKGADVNAAPVPSSKDTALTIAADKGHYKFVELILRHGSFVDVKNKKGNSPLWLACNGGHLDVVRLLVQYGADVDSQDNRKISGLMVAFKRGHLKVVKYLVEHVTQFPSDAELTRYVSNLTDKELLKRCQRCMEVIIDAKERQAAEANKNATSLLLEIDQEKKHEEDRKAAAARKRAKKKRQKEKKQALKAQKDSVGDKDEGGTGDSPLEGDGSGGPDDYCDDDIPEAVLPDPSPPSKNSRLPDQLNQVIAPPIKKDVVESSSLRNKKNNIIPTESQGTKKQDTIPRRSDSTKVYRNPDLSKESENRILISKSSSLKRMPSLTMKKEPIVDHSTTSVPRTSARKTRTSSAKSSVGGSSTLSTTPSSSPRKGRREDGWKEVGRRTKKAQIPGSVFGQVVGKNSCNLNAVKQGTNTQIEIDKVSKQSATRTLTIRGSADAIKLAHQCIITLAKDPNQDLAQLIRKITGVSPSTQLATASAHKRYVLAPSDPPPSIAAILDPYNELPAAPPATGGTTAPGCISVVSTTTATPAVAIPTKPLHKKGSSSHLDSIPALMSVTGASATIRTNTDVTSSHGPPDQKLQHHLLPDPKPASVVAVTAAHSNRVIGSIPLPSVATGSTGTLPTVLVRTSSSGSTSQSVGAVRKLFVSPVGPQTTKHTTVHAQSTKATLSTAQSGYTRAVPSQVSSRLPTSAPSHTMAKPASVVTTPHMQDSYHGSGPKSQSTVEPIGKVVMQNLKGATSVQPPTTSGADNKQMSYSRVIASQDTSRVQPPQLSLVTSQQHGDIIEQPVQQIMKTPTIFQEPAAQLTKPKKISTYSDAVGKKPVATSSGISNTSMAIAYSSSGNGEVTFRMGHLVGSGQASMVYSASSVPIPPPSPQLQSPKLNLAPGSRPVSGDGEDKSHTGHFTSEKHGSRSTPWNDLVMADKVSPEYHQTFDEDMDKLSPPTSSLGPIGPPSNRSFKPSVNPAAVGTGSVKQGTHCRSYSPGSRPKTSPAGISASPQRNDMSPAAKSPLLGPAPPGLLPPPDKGGYGSSFRPIQQLHGVPPDYPPPVGDTSGSSTGSSVGNFQTLVPTPVRNQRPPLLATPPGLSMLQQGVRISPIASPEKTSPNKSPPHPAMKGFNPNAPSFVPMALQSGPRPNVPSTSSILGAPPTAKFPGFGPPAVANSILGNAPPLPIYGNSNNQPRMISPVPSIFPSQHPPPNVLQPPGPPQQQPNQLQQGGSQSSILGQPPPIFGGPVIPCGVPQGFVPNLQNHPPGPGPAVYGGPQLENNQAPPPTMQHPHPPYGISLIPFQSPAQSPILNGPQPTQTFIGGQPGQVLVSTPLTEGYQVPSIVESQQQGGPPSGVADGGSEFPKFGVSMMYASKSGDGSELSPIPASSIGLNLSGHQPVLFSAATHSATLPITSAGVSGVRSNDSLFNLSINSLSSLYPNQQVAPSANETGSGAEDSKVPVDVLKFQQFSKESKGKVEGMLSYTPLPYLQRHPVGYLSTNQSSDPPRQGPHGGFILMTSGGFSNAPPNATISTTVPLSEDGVLVDSLLPIGTERAQRSSTAPSFAVLPPGILPSNVWSYSGTTASEDSDWSKVPSETSWPSLPGGESTVTSQDTLESVLGKLGLLDYYNLLQRNEIDLNALMLMSEKDFAEIGLPAEPRQTLLLGIGRLPTLIGQDNQGPVSPVTSGIKGSISLDTGTSTGPLEKEQAPSLLGVSASQ